MSTEKSLFGSYNGTDVNKYTIKNCRGMSFSVIEYGATLTNVFAPDKNGKFVDVLVGFDDLDGFVERSDYQGMTVGPYANRIGGAKFSIDGREYNLTANEKGVTSLHSNGELSHKVWKYESSGENYVSLTTDRRDGVGGYPGNMNFTVKFTLTDDNKIKIEYRAVSDKKTYINLTNHSYFNLSGFAGGSILDTKIKIDADYFTPVDEFSIPKGKLKEVEGKAFDFREFHKIGERIENDCRQLKNTHGYDHNFCINNYDGSLRKCAEAVDEKSGIKLEVFTTLPGVQFYTGNFLNGTIGKDGKPMKKRTGFCFETQYYPDTPNNPSFPSCLFDAGQEYTSETCYLFSAE